MRLKKHKFYSILKITAIAALFVTAALFIATAVACETPHTHEYDDGTVIKPATCSEDGSKKLTCKICGESMTVSIAAGHDYGDWTIYDDARHERKCKVCHETEFGNHAFQGEYCSVCNYRDGGGLEYTSMTSAGDPGYYLSGRGAVIPDSELKIPATYKGLPVMGIDANALKDFTFVEKITIPEHVRYLFGDNEDSPNPFCNCPYLREITVDENNQYFSSENGILYSKDKTVIYHVPARISASNFTVKEGVKEIAQGAFFNNASSPMSISLPQSLTKIGRKAFGNCTHLNSITVPQSVETIEEYAFEGCNLNTATFEFLGYHAETWGYTVSFGNLLEDERQAARYLTEEYVSYQFVKYQ